MMSGLARAAGGGAEGRDGSAFRSAGNAKLIHTNEPLGSMMCTNVIMNILYDERSRPIRRWQSKEPRISTPLRGKASGKIRKTKLRTKIDEVVANYSSTIRLFIRRKLAE